MMDASMGLMAWFDRLCDASPAESDAQIRSLRAQDAPWVDTLVEMLNADREQPKLVTPDAISRLLARAADPAPAHRYRLDNGAMVAARYRVQAPAGMGATSEVYRAVDTHEDTVVALKVLLHRRVSPRALYRLEREYQSIARLSHPGVLRVHAIGESDGLHYIVMDWVAGDLRRWRGAPVCTLLPLLSRVCAALDHVHRSGIVHRDLKPENILYGPDSDWPRLADFGVIRLMDQAGTFSTADGTIVGTVDYLSPEQVTGAAVDPRSDLYALGCMIFEMIGGRPPFEGTLYERLHRRTTEDAPSLGEVAPETPEALVILVERLLQRDPRGRPASGWDVAMALAEMHDDGTISAISALEPTRQGAWLYSSGCEGRDRELASLLAQSEAKDSPRVSCLVGTAGSGKTTLCKVLQQRLRGAGWSVLSTRMEVGDATPFAPLPALVKRAESSTNIAIEAADADRNPLGDDGRGKVLHVRAEHLCSRLVATAAGRPLAVVLEDMHAVGKDAFDLLRVICEVLRERGVRAWVLMTLRPHAEDMARARSEITHFERLEPLSDDAVTRAIRHMLGADVHDVAAALIDEVVALAEGSPLVAVSSVRALVTQSRLTRERGQWVASVEPSESVVASIVSNVFVERLTGLTLRQQTVLRAAALVGDASNISVVARVAAVEEETAATAVDVAVRRGILREESRGRLRFEHALVIDQLLEALDDQECDAMHDRAAEALRAEGASERRVAWHLCHGSRADVAIDAARSAAENARSAHDYGLASNFLKLALARTPSDAPTAALREQLGDVLVPLGEVEHALALYKEAEKGVGEDALRRARLARKRAIAMLRTDRAGAALDLLRSAFRWTGGRIPKSRALQVVHAMRHFALARLRAWAGRRSTAPLLIERATIQRELALLHRWVDLYQSAAYVAGFTSLAERLDPQEFRVDAYGFDSFFFALLGMDRVSRVFGRAGRELARRGDDALGLMRLSLTRGGTELLVHGDIVASAAHMAAGVAIAERTRDDFALAFAYSSQGWGLVLQGDARGALPVLERAEVHGRRASAHWIVADAALLRAYVTAICGDVDEAVAVANRILGSEIRVAFPVFEALGTEILAGCAMFDGRLHESVALYERAKEAYRRHGLQGGWGLLVPLSHVEALCALADELGADNVPDLIPRLRHSTRWAARWLRGRLLYAGCVHVLRGVLASRQGHQTKARRWFQKAQETQGRTRPAYIDFGIRLRIVTEALCWEGLTRALGKELDALAQGHEAHGLWGMQRWGVRLQATYGAQGARQKPNAALPEDNAASERCAT